jgi:cytoskeletal protein CcmA (bactofilin family)
MPSRIQLRRDTAANWAAINPVLALGEPGLDTTIDLLKYGDGVTAWNSLPYSGSNPGSVGNIIPALSNTYTLGNATNSWQALYVSGNTIYLGNIQLGSNTNQLLINGNAVPTLGGNVSFDSVHANANITTNGFISATGNISAGNLAVANNVVIEGNLTVNGNTTYENVTSFNVEDPIIGLGRAANNEPLVSNDGKDRGEQLWYYNGAEKSAFIGYVNPSNPVANIQNKMVAATSVTITNEVVSVSSYGNFVAGNVEGASVSVTGNITANNVVFANTISATGNISGNYFVGNGAVLTDVMADRGADLNNWNSMTQMGVYTVNRVSWSGTIGTPLDSQVYVGLVEVKNSTSTALSQVFYPGTIESGNVKIQWNRTYWSGTWSSWFKIVNDDQVVVGGAY